VTMPFPVMLTPGHAGNHSGIIDRVWIVNNIFDQRAMPAPKKVYTAGVQLSEDQAGKGYQFGFKNTHIVGNKFYGMGWGVVSQLNRTSLMPDEPHSVLNIEDNEFRNMLLGGGFQSIRISGRSQPNDLVYIGRNLTDLGNCGGCTVYNITTTATVLKYGNKCLRSGISSDCN
jgi:hypothetical protein